jgi:repressor LexA
MKGPTQKQRAVFEFIKSQIVQTNRPPTIREIGNHFNMRSTGSVRDVLRALAKKGFIDKDPNVSRGIRIKVGPGPLAGEIVELSVINEIAPGSSLEAYENIEDSVKLNKSMLPDGETFVVRVRDNSMTQANINKGDYAFVRRQPTCRSSQIVAVALGGKISLRKFSKKGNSVVLLSNDKKPKPIEIASHEFSSMLLGVLVAVFRRLV